MKKTMRMLMAALLAIACLPMTGVSAAEELKPYGNYGTIMTDSFGDYEKVDTKGMLGTVYVKYGTESYQDREGGTVQRNKVNIYSIHPREQHLRFRLRDGLDAETARPKVLEITEKYYPGVTEAWNTEFNSAWVGQGIDKPDYQLSYAGFSQSKDFGLTFDLYDTQQSEDAAQKADGLRKDLAAAGLLSEFYSWGQTADYERIEDGAGVLCYPNCSDDYTKYDIESVNNYLTENHAGYTVELIGEQMNADPNPYRSAFRIKTSDAITAKDEFMLAIELYEQLGLRAQYAVLETASGSMLSGSNAMECPGDTNLDCEVDILDVIAANKNILGVGTLDKTGVKNADMNGNGTTDPDDSLAILKTVIT